MGQFSDRRLKFVSSNPIPKNLIKMSEEVKTDAPAEAVTAEDLKGQKRSLEEEAADGEIKKAKTANGSSNGADKAENGAAEEEEAEAEEEDLEDEDELDGEEGEEDLDEEAEGEEGEEEEDGEGEEEEDEEDASFFEESFI